MPRHAARQGLGVRFMLYKNHNNTLTKVKEKPIMRKKNPKSVFVRDLERIFRFKHIKTRMPPSPAFAKALADKPENKV